MATYKVNRAILRKVGKRKSYKSTALLCLDIEGVGIRRVYRDTNKETVLKRVLAGYGDEYINLNGKRVHLKAAKYHLFRNAAKWET